MGRLYGTTETMRRVSLAAEVVNFDQVAGTKIAPTLPVKTMAQFTE
jgi:hypothetical protein